MESLGEKINLNISLEKSVLILEENGYAAAAITSEERGSALESPEDVFYWIIPRETLDLNYQKRNMDSSGEFFQEYPTRNGIPMAAGYLHRNGSLTLTYIDEKVPKLSEHQDRIRELLESNFYS